LRAGDIIAITAPSSGVTGAHLPRLDLVLAYLRDLGYHVIEGECLRSEIKNASSAAKTRAREFERFLLDPEVAAIFPPWGGELASELLEFIDFDSLRSVEPKWLLGYSDISTLLLPLTLISGWATAHGPNLMELSPTQTDPLTTSALSVLSSDFGSPVHQQSSSMFQATWIDFAEQVDAPLNLTETTEWKRLDGAREGVEFHGRLIGGCIDTIAWLAGTDYGDIPEFIRKSGPQSVVLYLENAEMSPLEIVRSLLSLKRQNWFEGVAGVMLGRSAGAVPDSSSSLTYVEALHAVLDDLPCTVLYDVDIGHMPPQFTLINGAFAHVVYEEGRGSITQHAGA
jgi:muramoyltetrapeptide carboxypeptidase LdcA involved in peptidoglycan recycling